MGGFLEQMMKVSMNVMVSSMETITESMETITKTMQVSQQEPETPDETEDSDGTDEGWTSALSNVSRLTAWTFFEMLKLPMNVLASSTKTIFQTTQEPQEQAAADDGGANSGEAAENYEEEIVPLGAQEAALETKAILTQAVEATSNGTLWQIGRSGRSEFEGKWTAAFDYHVGTDIDAINSPGIPHFITVQAGPKTKGATEKLSIHFTLDRDYSNGELAFIYDRWGAEKDQVLVDGELLAPISGPGKGKFKHVALSLKDVINGNHIITITTSGDTEAGGHRIDYLKLTAIEQTAERG